jgi:hypothetical protein
MGAKVKPRAYNNWHILILEKVILPMLKLMWISFLQEKRKVFCRRLPVESRYLYRWWGNLRRCVCIIHARAAADTVLQTKIDFMTKAADYFKTKNVQSRKLICVGDL